MKEIDTQDVEAFVDGAGVSDSTNAKNVTILRAVWNSWNKHNAKQRVEGDPFAFAVSDSKAAAKTSAKIRRPMIPSEFEYLYDHKLRQSSAIHRDYGAKMPASDTLDLMRRIDEISDWGFIEEYDE